MRDLKPHTDAGDAMAHRGRGDDLSSGLARIAARARSHPKERFTNLMHHLTPEKVMECLKRIPNDSAPGVDEMTAEQARENINWLLREPLRRIHEGRYEAPPVRRVYIPKAGGRQRPIGVPTVLDRAIQAGVADILNQVYEQDFQNCSFGFRRGKSCHHALATIHEAVGRWGMNIALEVDIRDFFGSLNHGWLRKFLEHRIGDKRVLRLIDAWLAAGVMEEGRWQEAGKGTPQGGSISPLLANVYLHYVLDLWFERIIKGQLRGRAVLVRYCDDFVILFQDRGDAEKVRTLLRARLNQFGLEVAEEKTHLTDLTPRKRSEGGERRRMTFLGFNIFKTRKRSGRGYRLTFQTEGKRFSRAKRAMKEQLARMRHYKVAEQARRVGVILQGHMNYYGMAGNSRRIQSFCYETVRHWRRSLSRRSQRGLMNWEEMRKILARFPLPRPRLVLTYEQLGAYAML